MITANDVRKKLKEINLCDGIDEWIEEYLIPKFVLSPVATVSDSIIDRGGKGWTKDSFTVAMRQRGFAVEYYCEDRPCGQCYYKIILPPGNE